MKRLTLTPYQAKILDFMFQNLDIGESANTLEFALTGDFDGTFRVAFAEIAGLDQYVVFNLPTYANQVFVCLSRRYPKESALILANLEDYVREKNIALDAGEVVVIPAQIASSSNSAPFAVFLLRTASSVDCANLPDRLLIDDKLTSFLLAIPLTKPEYELRSREGHDALIDNFEKTNKDVLFA